MSTIVGPMREYGWLVGSTEEWVFYRANILKDSNISVDNTPESTFVENTLSRKK